MKLEEAVEKTGVAVLNQLDLYPTFVDAVDERRCYYCYYVNFSNNKVAYELSEAERTSNKWQSYYPDRLTEDEARDIKGSTLMRIGVQTGYTGDIKPGRVEYIADKVKDNTTLFGVGMREGEPFCESISKEGAKHDEGKLRYDLIPPDAERQKVRVLTFGAKKYGDRNWEKGIAYSRIYAALQRHLAAWRMGETFDPETKIHHLAHTACCIDFLLTYELRSIGKDDLTKEVE